MSSRKRRKRKKKKKNDWLTEFTEVDKSKHISKNIGSPKNRMVCLICIQLVLVDSFTF